MQRKCSAVMCSAVQTRHCRKRESERERDREKEKRGGVRKELDTGVSGLLE